MCFSSEGISIWNLSNMQQGLLQRKDKDRSKGHGCGNSCLASSFCTLWSCKSSVGKRSGQRAEGYPSSQQWVVFIVGSRRSIKYHFIDPKTAVPIQTVERLWDSLRSKNKWEWGTKIHYSEAQIAVKIRRGSKLKNIVWHTVQYTCNNSDCLYYIFKVWHSCLWYWKCLK